MVIKGCLFDLDGVLVDTARFHYLAWKHLADKLGFAFTETDNERLKGISRMDSLDILLQIGKMVVSDKEKIKYAEEKNELYLGYIVKMTPEDVLPGVVKFLQALKEKDMLIGLGSASKNARLILKKTALEPLFDVVVDGNLVSRAKPDPEVFSLGARLLELENQECLVFEDAVAGIQAAHNAGMKCIGVGSADILSDADIIIPGFVDLQPEKLIFQDRLQQC